MTTSKRAASRVLLAFCALFILLSSVSMIASESKASADTIDTTPATFPLPDPKYTGNGANSGQANEALHGTTGIIGEAAIAALSSALNKLGLWTTPQVAPKKGDGVNWFVVHYRMMRVMGLWILMPMVLIAIIHAIFKASVSMLLKTVFVYLPIAIVGTAAAVDLVQLLLNVTDDFSNVFLDATIQNADSFFASVADGFSNQAVPFLLDLVMALLLAFVCVAVYVVMVLREGSIYIATSFLPIGFALMVWPATARWFKRMVEFLFGIVLSKLIMVAAISLAIASLTAAGGGTAAGTAGLTVNGGNVGTVGLVSDNNNSILSWSGNVASSIALLLVVCLAPHMTIRLVANLGVGEMGSHAANAIQRPSALPQLLFFDRIMGNKTNLEKLTRAQGRTKESKALARGTSIQEKRLQAAGVFRNSRDNYEIDDQMLDSAGITDTTLRRQLIDMTTGTNADNANGVLIAHLAMGMGNDFAGFNRGDITTTLMSKTNKTAIVMNINDNKGHVINHHPPALVRQMIRQEADRQIADKGGVSGINVIAPMPSRLDPDSGRMRARSNQDYRNERNIAQAVWRERSQYEGVGGLPPNIRATFRSSAGVWSRVNRPLDPREAAHAAGRF